MAPLHIRTGGTAVDGSGSSFLTRLKIHGPSRKSVSDETPVQSSASKPSKPGAETNNVPQSSLDAILSRFHLGRRGANEQPDPTPSACQTGAGMAEPPPVEPELEPESELSPQETSENSDSETIHEDRAWLADQQASPGTRVSARSSEDKDSSAYPHRDTTNSDHAEQNSDDDNDTEDVHQYPVLGAHNRSLDQPVYFYSIYNADVAVNVLSYPKACLIAPHDIGDGFSKVGKRTVRILGDEATVYGPISVEFWLQTRPSRVWDDVEFYVLPDRPGKPRFDAMLNIRVV